MKNDLIDGVQLMCQRRLMASLIASEKRHQSLGDKPKKILYVVLDMLFHE